MKLGACISLGTQLNPQQIKDLSLNPEEWKLSEKNRIINFTLAVPKGLSVGLSSTGTKIDF